MREILIVLNLAQSASTVHKLFNVPYFYLAWAGAAVSSASPYNDAVLGSGPKYYWTFDEDGVADALEQVSGNAADVFRPSAESAKAPSTLTPGGISLGQALALDNTVTSVWNTDDLSGPAFSGAWAVEVWINSADPQAYQYIVGSQAENDFNTGTIAQFSNFEDDPGNPRILLFTLFSAPHSFNADSAPQSDGWHHWVFVTKTPTQGTDVYRDGTLLGTFGNESVIAPFPARELRAGGWSPTPVAENFTGQIDELAYYDLSGLDEAALAAKGEEIANHYNTDTGGPTIDTQPEGQSVNPGANVTFTVAASGGALTYLWEKFGAGWEPIAGATSASLVLNAVTAADAGQYRVRVTNAAGPINSLPATLDVIPPPTAYNSAVLASNPTYYWTFDEAGLANAREQVGVNAGDVFRPSSESAKAPSTTTAGGASLGWRWTGTPPVFGIPATCPAPPSRGLGPTRSGSTPPIQINTTISWARRPRAASTTALSSSSPISTPMPEHLTSSCTQHGRPRRPQRSRVPDGITGCS